MVGSIELSSDDSRLLVLISHYSKPAGLGVRYNALRVLIYEAIVEGVLTYDFAPAPVLLTVNGKDETKWMNVSREAEAAMDRMAQLELIDQIKATSALGGGAALCFNVTTAGMAHIQTLPSGDRTSIAGFLRRHSAKPNARLEPNFLSVVGRFEVSAEGLGSANASMSGVTSVVKPPTVTSAWLPSAHIAAKLTLLNASRAHEAMGQGSKAVSAKEMSTFSSLANPIVLLGEWAPVGEEQLRVLQLRLHSSPPPAASTKVVLNPSREEVRQRQEAEAARKAAADAAALAVEQDRQAKAAAAIERARYGEEFSDEEGAERQESEDVKAALANAAAVTAATAHILNTEGGEAVGVTERKAVENEMPVALSSRCSPWVRLVESEPAPPEPPRALALEAVLPPQDDSSRACFLGGVGVCISVDGAIGVGAAVNGCNGESGTSLSLDSMSLLLAQLITSSSALATILLSPWQSSVLACLCGADADGRIVQRDKHVLVLADEMEPVHTSASELLGDEQLMAEMAQVIGKVQHVALLFADESGARGDDDAEEDDGVRARRPATGASGASGAAEARLIASAGRKKRRQEQQQQQQQEGREGDLSPRKPRALVMRGERGTLAVGKEMSADEQVKDLLIRHSRASSLEGALGRLRQAVARGEARMSQIRRACASPAKPLAEDVPKLQQMLADMQNFLSSLEHVQAQVVAALRAEVLRAAEIQEAERARQAELDALAEAAAAVAREAVAKAAELHTAAQREKLGSDASDMARAVAVAARKHADLMERRAEAAADAAAPRWGVKEQLAAWLNFDVRYRLLDKQLLCILRQQIEAREMLQHVTVMSVDLEIGERVTGVRRVEEHTRALAYSICNRQQDALDCWHCLLFLLLAHATLALVDLLASVRWDGRIRQCVSPWRSDGSIPAIPDAAGFLVLLKALAEVPGLMVGIHLGLILAMRVALATVQRLAFPAAQSCRVERRYALTDKVHLPRLEQFLAEQTPVSISHTVVSSHSSGTSSSVIAPASDRPSSASSTSSYSSYSSYSSSSASGAASASSAGRSSQERRRSSAPAGGVADAADQAATFKRTPSSIFKRVPSSQSASKGLSVSWAQSPIARVAQPASHLKESDGTRARVAAADFGAGINKMLGRTRQHASNASNGSFESPPPGSVPTDEAVSSPASEMEGRAGREEQQGGGADSSRRADAQGLRAIAEHPQDARLDDDLDGDAPNLTAASEGAAAQPQGKQGARAGGGSKASSAKAYALVAVRAVKRWALRPGSASAASQPEPESGQDPQSASDRTATAEGQKAGEEAEGGGAPTSPLAAAGEGGTQQGGSVPALAASSPNSSYSSSYSSALSDLPPRRRRRRQQEKPKTFTAGHRAELTRLVWEGGSGITWSGPAPVCELAYAPAASELRYVSFKTQALAGGSLGLAKMLAGVKGSRDDMLPALLDALTQRRVFASQFAEDQAARLLAEAEAERLRREEEEARLLEMELQRQRLQEEEAAALLREEEERSKREALAAAAREEAERLRREQEERDMEREREHERERVAARQAEEEARRRREEEEAAAGQGEGGDEAAGSDSNDILGIGSADQAGRVFKGKGRRNKRGA